MKTEKATEKLYTQAEADEMIRTAEDRAARQYLELAVQVLRALPRGMNGELLQKHIERNEPLRILLAQLNQPQSEEIIASPIVPILHLDPKIVFDPTEFIGEGWTVWKGAADGEGLIGEGEVDARSLFLTAINLSEILFENGLIYPEIKVSGEDKLRRLRASGNIQFGGNVFLALCKDYQINKKNSSLEWLWENREVSHLYFFGLVLRNPLGRRHILCLHRDNYKWRSSTHSWLRYFYRSEDVSCGLES